VIAALVLGGAVGAGSAAGAALLLYTGQGFLATAGFLIAVIVTAVAAGVWVGVPDPGALSRRAEPTRARWIWVIVAFSLAGLFVTLWDRSAMLRQHQLGGALAVLLVLAEPAYASGTLIAALQWRDVAGARARGARIVVAMLIGIAAGVLLAAILLIPRFDPPAIFLGAAVLLALFGANEATRPHATAAEPPTMNGRVVLITGVGDPGQLGYAIARRFLAAGAQVMITNRSGDPARLAAELTPPGAFGLAADLSVDPDVERLIGAIRDRFGRLDALVHAAGGLSVAKSLAETQPEEWRREIERNADTAFRISRAVLPLLRESRGAIVHIASPAGLRAVARLGAYSAAKAAVVALTRALALEEKQHGIRVNAIAPAMIDTEQNRRTADPDARFVTREQVAETALFLASEAASGVSGETLRVMGDALR